MAAPAAQGIHRGRQIGDENGLGGALTNLGEVYRAEGDLAKAEGLYREALEIFRKLGRVESGATDGVSPSPVSLPSPGAAALRRSKVERINPKAFNSRSQCLLAKLTSPVASTRLRTAITYRGVASADA